MKILYLINYAGRAGTERYVENLARIFGEAGHECHLCFNLDGGLAEKLRDKGLPVFQLDMGRSAVFTAPAQLGAYCREHGIEVIHAQYPRENIIALLSRRYYSAAKVVFTSHLTVAAGTKWRILNKLFSPGNHRVIAVCRQGAELLEANGVPPEIISVIYNGVEPVAEPVRERSILPELGVEEDCFIMSILARYAPEKGLDFLLEAIAELKRRTDRPFRLIIGGDGELFDEIAAQRDELGLAEEVVMAGFRSDSGRILSASDLYLNSSACNEAMSFAILEAMNAGLPLVVTDVGGNRDLAETDIVCGSVVSHGDVEGFASALLQYMENPELCAEMGKNASAKVAKSFDLTALAWDVFETYR